MGKLSYGGRKIDGLKAGKIVSKDLRKRIPPFSTSKAAGRDPHLEIDLSGKHLADDGFLEFSIDVTDAIKFHDEDHPDGVLTLEELNLKDNKLTTSSLPALGEVIKLSVGSLKALDISSNDISISTEADRLVWATFLESFSGCFMLRRLDLSDNSIGLAGFDILARVYLHSELDFVAPAEDDQQLLEALVGLDIAVKGVSCKSKAAGVLEGKENIKANSSTLTPAKPKGTRDEPPSEQAYRELRHYASTRGLRSVPNLVLSNTTMTDASSLFVAHMAAMHRLPHQLFHFLPPSKTIVSASQPAGPWSPTTGSCRGIQYLPNAELTADGKKLLMMAEKKRDERCLEDDKATGSEDETQDNSPSRRVTSVKNALEVALPAICEDPADEETKERVLRKRDDTLFDRQKIKIQMRAIKEQGVTRVQLWAAAMRMVAMSRAILLGQNKNDSMELLEIKGENGIMANTRDVNGQIAKPRGTGEFADGSGGRFAKHSPQRSHDERFTDLSCTNRPSLEGSFPNGHRTLPHCGRQPRESYESEFPPIHSLTTDFHGTGGVRLGFSAAVNASRKDRISCPSDHKVCPALRFGLDAELWRQCLADASGATPLLSRDQQEAVIRYAMDRGTLHREMEIIGKPKEQQIWKILDSIGCLMYEGSA